MVIISLKMRNPGFDIFLESDFSRADTSHDCQGGGGEGAADTQNFLTIKPSRTTAITTAVGTYVKFMHYMIDLTPQ